MSLRLAVSLRLAANERNGSTSVAYELPPADDPCPLCTTWTDEPQYVVAEGEHAVAIVSPRRRAAGAVVLFPRAHVTTATDLSPEAMAGLWRLVHRVTVAIERAYEPDGMHTWEDVGVLADASFPHLTVDVVPRWEGEPYRYRPYSALEPTDHAQRIRDVTALRAALVPDA